MYYIKKYTIFFEKIKKLTTEPVDYFFSIFLNIFIHYYDLNKLDTLPLISRYTHLPTPPKQPMLKNLLRMQIHAPNRFFQFYNPLFSFNIPNKNLYTPLIKKSSS
jgi:hypothetical protein